ncbi:Hsp20/alpha crystallin family protein [Pedobacter sp. JCM 36344]|uniref:Hsp20/alpha crystallin family protein n=1 Tax=Pedobacter sp. JCM 36344 TaxID=3374280 RepID=UPI00397B1B3B
MSSLSKTTKSSKACSMMENFWDTEVFNNASDPSHPVNIRERDHKFKIEIAAPGFKKRDFKVSVDNDLLTILAESNREDGILDEDYTRMEFSRSSFTGSFSLPKNVSSDRISANYRNGLLTINLKKSGKFEPGKRVVKVC